MANCLKCGDTGIMNDMSFCTCEAGKERRELEGKASKLPDYIPEGYGARFEGALLTSPYDDICGDELDKLYNFIIKTKKIPKNYFISLPPNTGKSMFMWSVIAELDKYNICECPMSFKEIEQTFKTDEALTSRIQTAPIFFVNVEQIFPDSLVSTLDTLITKRTAVNNRTIFMSSAPWFVLCKRFPWLNKFKGNGLLKTILVKEYKQNDKV